MGNQAGITPLWFIILAFACALLASMVFLAIAEALVPTGSIPGPLEAVAAIRRRAGRSRRYLRITRILIRHGLGPYLRGRHPTWAPPPAAYGWPARCGRRSTRAGSRS